MADIKSREKRSANMAKILCKDTKPEKYVRSLLHRKGLRFRINYKDIAGKPDLYFTKKRVAVFIHGCFWHRHADCSIAYTPKSNVEFWQKKFSSNTRRDAIVRNMLLSEGIRILVIWECTIRRMKRNSVISDQIIESAYSFITEGKEKYLEL